MQQTSSNIKKWCQCYKTVSLVTDGQANQDKAFSFLSKSSNSTQISSVPN